MQNDASPSAPISVDDRYRRLVDAVIDYAIYMLDPDGFVVSWNSGAQRLKGYTEAEIVGRHFSQFYAPDDVRAGMPARTLHTAKSEGRFEAEGWRIRKNGERFWAHVVVDPILTHDGRLLGYAKVTRDLSERRRAEEALRQSEEQFRLLVQGVTDYAIYMLNPSGVVTNWNAGAQRIKGYAPEEVIGTHFSRFYREQERAAGQPAKALATAAAEGRFEAEGWRVRKDGTEFWANVVVDPIRNAMGELIGFAKITRDVTEKRDVQLKLERAREELFQSQKLDAIGQLTGGVAHDFNNLLMVVLSSLELLKRRLRDDEKSTQLIENAVKGARRGVTLTQRMLSFARRQELAPVAVDIRALVDGMQDLLERSLGPTIRVTTDFDTVPRPVLIDPNQLELAILNLAVNARDAMPQGGTLRIATQHEQVTNAPPLAPGDYVRLSITDSGGGMSAATLERAMEPFFTTKGTGKGTGLGLPMVQGLAAQSGGQFVLNSTEGVGTTAELWLPVAPDGTALRGHKAAAADTIAGGDALLVVAVDDDALVLTGTVAMLEELGHTVLPAASAQAALALVENEPNVGLVVTDQAMPVMTGAELTRRLKHLRPELPVVLATGFGEVPDDLETRVVRLAKPFDERELAQAIQTVSRREAARRSASASPIELAGPDTAARTGTSR